MSSGFNINSWIRAANASGAVIVWYQHPSIWDGLHYVAGVSQGRHGKFKFYNENRVSNRSAITISTFTTILRDAGCKMLMIIGVSGLR